MDVTLKKDTANVDDVIIAKAIQNRVKNNNPRNIELSIEVCILVSLFEPSGS